MASTVSCIVVTTLFVVSIANLLLLVHIVMQGFKIGERSAVTKKLYNYLPRPPRDDSHYNESQLVQMLLTDYRIEIDKYKFMASLISVQSGDIEFVCSASIIGRNWVITSAHCAALITKVPLDKLKISCNSSKVKYGSWHDLDKIITHDNFDPYRYYNDISLMSVKQPFKLIKGVESVALASGKFEYLANSSALSLGFAPANSFKNTSTLSWNSNEKLYGVNVTLFSTVFCQNRYPEDDVFDKSMFCVGKYRNATNILCVLDHGGQLYQNGILIGIVAFNTGCNFNGNKPTIYTKIGDFEKWINDVDKKYEADMNVVFKSRQ